MADQSIIRIGKVNAGVDAPNSCGSKHRTMYVLNGYFYPEPNTHLSAFAIAFKEENIRNVRALIIGPPGTPYEFGFFEVCLTMDLCLSLLTSTFVLIPISGK
jgi:hypothetical protein